MKEVLPLIIKKDLPVKEIPVVYIDYAKDRHRIDDGDIEEMANTLKDQGQLNPIVVMEQKDNPNKYWLIAGKRRLLAIIYLGQSTIRATVAPYSDDELVLATLELVENTKRKNLHYGEAVAAKEKIHNLYIARFSKRTAGSQVEDGWSIKQTAELFGEKEQNFGQDLKVAKAIREDPSIAKMSSLNEAKKLLEKKLERELKEAYVQRQQTKLNETSLDKRKQILIDLYKYGDCIKEMKKLSYNIISFMEIDPPYITGRELSKVKIIIDNKSLENFHNGENISDYSTWILTVLEQSYRILKDNSWCVLWFDIKELSEILKCIRAVGFECNGIPGIWIKHKPGGCMNPEVSLASSYETFFYMRKGKPALNKKGRSNVFSFPHPAKKVHPTERPIELMQDLIEVFTITDPICVPFLGSGNTMLAAANLGLSCFGWDLDKSYKADYIIKVKQNNIGDYSSFKE